MEALLLEISLLAYLAATIGGSARLVGRDLPAGARLSRIGLTVGLIAHASAILVRSSEVGTLAVSSVAEQVSLFGCLLVALYLLAESRYRLLVLAAVVAPIGFAGALATLVDHGGVRDVPPDLRSPWLAVHVTLAFLGNAAFSLACLVSVIYLFQERKLKAHRLRDLTSDLPALETLDLINYRLLTWGFVLLTMGMLSGSLWAELSFGRPWSWEPRTIWSLVIWVLYAGLLHGRVTVGWGGRRAATLTIVTFGLLFFSFLGVNVLAPGQHAASFG